MNDSEEIIAKKIMLKNLTNIDNIYNTYKYLNIPKDEYYDYVLNIIDSLRKENPQKSVSFSIIKKQIIRLLNHKLDESILDEEKLIGILNSYINDFNNNTYEDVISNMKLFAKFLKKHSINLTEDNVMLLLLNPIFNNMVEMIFNHHRESIKNGYLEDLFNTDFIVLSILAYCSKNDIELNFNDDIVKDNNKSNKISFYDEVSQIPLLDVKEEKELLEKVAEGNMLARKKFIESNLRLVINIASRYQNRGLTFLDLVQEGSIGLINAVDNFDLSRGYRFSTYATICIQREISNALATKTRIIRISIETYNELMNFINVKRNLEMRLNRDVKIEELANELNIPISKAITLYNLQTDTLSLDYKISEDDDSEFQEFVIDQNILFEDTVIDGMLRKDLLDLLNAANLTEKELDVLKLRYGFYNEEVLTQKVIAEKYGLTHQSIMQTEAKAIRKIRRCSKVKDLLSYTDNPDVASKNIDFFRGNLNQKQDDSDNISILSILRGYTKNQIKEILNNLPIEDLSLIKLKYDLSLDSLLQKTLDEHDDVIDNYLLPKILKLLRISIEKILDYDDYLDIVSELTSKEAMIISLKYGFVDGECHSNQYISNYIHWKETEIKAVINKGLLLAKEKINGKVFVPDNVLKLTNNKS